MFDTVAKAFSILDNGVTQLQERVSQAYESLNLAATDTLYRHFLLPYFHKWQLQESEIGLHIINRPSPDCVELVLNKEAQLAVLMIMKACVIIPQLGGHYIGYNSRCICWWPWTIKGRVL